ncbi:MAG TPA: LysE family translocator [Stellaceae bacterium]|nr:LysE family translocator [Stellaceae bacterium]
MPPIDHLLPFVAATLVFAYIPGPAILYTAAQTLARGRAAGLMAALGIHCGGYFHVVCAAFGLSAVLHYVPALYLAVKLAGAAYLVWLGIGMIRGGLDASRLPQVAAKGPRRAFVESIVVEICNPKAAIFFLAFLPQFVDPAAALPLALQFLVLGTIVNLTFSSADLVTILLTNAVLRGVSRAGLGQRIARLVGGSLLIGLGARLAVARD